MPVMANQHTVGLECGYGEKEVAAICTLTFVTSNREIHLAVVYTGCFQLLALVGSTNAEFFTEGNDHHLHP